MHAIVCHYKCNFYEVVSSLERYPISWKIHYPDTNYSNKFLHILVLTVDILLWTNRLKWKSISKMYKSVNKSDHQSFGDGFGFIGGQYNLLNNTVNKIQLSEPRKRKQTFDPSIKDVLI